jgi:hypothetical protein
MLTAVMLLVLRVVFRVAFTIMMTSLMVLRRTVLTALVLVLALVPFTAMAVLIILIAPVISAAVFAVGVVALAGPMAMRLRLLGPMLTLFFAVSPHHILRSPELFIGQTLNSFNDLVRRVIRARRFQQVLFTGRILLALQMLLNVSGRMTSNSSSHTKTPCKPSIVTLITICLSPCA